MIQTVLQWKTIIRQTTKDTNTWRLNSILLNKEWVNNKIKKALKRYFEVNKYENTTTQNLWDTVKEDLRNKLIAT